MLTKIQLGAIEGILNGLIVDNVKFAKSLQVAIKANDDTEAGSKLDQILSEPIQSAAEALGLPEEDVRNALVRMALERFADKADDMPEEEEPEDEPMMARSAEADEAPAADATEPTKNYMTKAEVEALINARVPKVPARRKGAAVANYVRNRGERTPLNEAVLAVARKNHNALSKFNERSYSEWEQLGANTRALGLNPDSAGGYLVPPEQTAEIIELLRSKSLFLAGESMSDLVTEVPLTSDLLNMPRQTGSGTAYWVGENSQITASDQEVGNLELKARKLAALTKMSAELVADGPDAEQFVIRDITKTLSEEVTRVVLYGSGTAAQPRGIYNHPSVTKTAISGTPTFSQLNAALIRLAEADVDDDGTQQWVLHPRDALKWQEIQDGAGQYIFTRGALTAGVTGMPPQYLGFPYNTTTKVTKSGNDTDAFIGRWSDLILGMRKMIEIRSSDEAGDAFEYDQVWVRAIMRMDIAIRHGESFEILTNCQ